MHIVRFIFVLVAFLFSGLVSYIGNIDLFKVLSLFSFILIVDSLTVKYLANLYLRQVYQQIEQSHFEKDKNDTDTE